jgi:hypothetical protein
MTATAAACDSIAILVRVAAGAEHQTWVAVRSTSVDAFDAALTLTDYEGEKVVFDVRVEQRGAALSVTEKSRHRRLPLACPERHINSDGSFCLGYQNAAVEDDPAAS